MLDINAASSILQFISQNHTTIRELVVFVLHNSSFSQHPLVLDIIQHPHDLLSCISDTCHQPPLIDWAIELANRSHVKSIQELSGKENGWHFGALHASVAQIQDFRLEEMAQKMRSTAPALWNTIISLLCVNNKPLRHQLSRDALLQDPDSMNIDDDSEEDDESQFWVGLDSMDTGCTDSPSEHPSKMTVREAITNLVRILTPSL
jgi:hypothetical protein